MDNDTLIHSEFGRGTALFATVDGIIRQELLVDFASCLAIDQIGIKNIDSLDQPNFPEERK